MSMSRAWTTLPLRPLPRPIVPMPDETIDSYLARLADANRLDPDALRAHITGDTRKSATIQIGALARISGQPERSLRYAIPELGTVAERADPHLTNRPDPHAPIRLSCKLCAAGRGHTGSPPRCRCHPERAVCLKHLRWLGDGIDHASLDQPDLTFQPVIVHANQTHRRLVALRGRPATDDAYSIARQLCHTWHERCERQEQFIELIRALCPDRRQLASNAAVRAARYPQTVAVTQLLVTSHWRRAAHEQWSHPEALIRDVYGAAAPGPRWTAQHDEPLIKML